MFSWGAVKTHTIPISSKKNFKNQLSLPSLPLHSVKCIQLTENKYIYSISLSVFTTSSINCEYMNSKVREITVLNNSLMAESMFWTVSYIPLFITCLVDKIPQEYSLRLYYFKMHQLFFFSYSKFKDRIGFFGLNWFTFHVHSLFCKCMKVS